MIEKRMRSVCVILASSIFICGLTTSGCDLTFGPVTKTKMVIVQSGSGVEILKNVVVPVRVMGAQENGSYDKMQQDIGGWIAMHPDHWASVKRTIESLRTTLREVKIRNGESFSSEDKALLGEVE